MGKSIRLHEEHGVNPTILQCFVCGETKNEIALLGAGYKDKAPMYMCLDPEPCDKCKEYMKQGVILISVKDDYRNWRCFDCKHRWSSPVRMSASSPAISGEAMEQCPKCNSRSVHGSEIIPQKGDNPYRTGGWCVVKKEALLNTINDPKLLEKGICFVPDSAWEMLGLPRGEESPGN